jgi:hypothetical protein
MAKMEEVIIERKYGGEAVHDMVEDINWAIERYENISKETKGIIQGTFTLKLSFTKEEDKI